MLDGFLTTDDLLALTGYKRVGDLERHLAKQGIRYFPGKDGPYTSRELINAAAGLKPGNDESYEDIL